MDAKGKIMNNHMCHGYTHRNQFAYQFVSFVIVKGDYLVVGTRRGRVDIWDVCAKKCVLSYFDHSSRGKLSNNRLVCVFVCL